MTRKAALLIIGFSVCVGAVAWTQMDAMRAVTLAADTFFIIYLALSCYTLPRASADQLKKAAAADDFPVGVIFLITLGAVAASVASLFILLHDKERTAIQFALAIASVPLGWGTVHMMAARHYAHLFWQPGPGEGGVRKGLDFPGTPKPCGWDFIDFSYVIGMTAQTSDTSINDTYMRKFHLGHALVSFLFNTVLVAAAVNVAVALGS